MAKDTYYFSHDYNTRSDSKIKKLLVTHGFFGYGLWWAIVEDLYNNANAMPTDYDGLAFEFRTDSKTIKSILHDFDLFVFKDEFFGSMSVQRRLDERNQKTVKARESAQKRWGTNANASKINAKAHINECEGNAIKERKGKEKKNTNHPFVFFGYPCIKNMPPIEGELNKKRWVIEHSRKAFTAMVDAECSMRIHTKEQKQNEYKMFYDQETLEFINYRPVKCKEPAE